LKQICVIEVQGNPRYPDAPAIPLTVLVNPVVTPTTEEQEEGWGGGSPVPACGARARRTPPGGARHTIQTGSGAGGEAKEFFARVIQHETDHLHGTVYLDRMRDFSTLTHLAEWNKYWLGIQEQDD